MVLDRLFLWIFSLASFLGTILILCEAPALYDETQPIDVEISRVYRSQYLPELDVKSTLWTISVAILSTNNDQECPKKPLFKLYCYGVSKGYRYFLTKHIYLLRLYIVVNNR